MAAWDPWAFIPENYNLGLDLTTTQVAHGRGNKVVLFWENALGNSRVLTYRELDALSTQLAKAFLRRGIGRGERILLRLPNIPEFYLAALAAAKNGSLFVPTSPQFRAGEVEYRLRHSGAVAVVVTSSLLPAVEEAATHCPELKHIFVVPYPEPSRRCTTYESWHDLLAEGRDDRSPWEPAETRHDDLAFLVYTSGTAGEAKGVAHFHRYARAYEGQGRFWHDYRDEDIVACPSDLGWLLPLATTFLYALSRGLSVVLYDGMGRGFDPVKWFYFFQRYRITNLTATPTVYRLLDAVGEMARRFDLTCWRHAVSCGEPLPAATFHAVRRRFGVAPWDGLGMSECPVYCCNSLGTIVRPGSCGHPSIGTTLALLDDQLQPVPRGREGILCVRRDRHPGMMRGYWQNLDETSRVFQGSWYVTGDVLRRDDDGYYWFQSRRDDLIKSAGYLISPGEVEDVLLEHPGVRESAVIGCPDAMRGSRVTALVVLNDGYQPSLALGDEICQSAKRRIAPYKCPKEVQFLAQLPKTVSGKIRRSELRRRLAPPRIEESGSDSAQED